MPDVLFVCEHGAAKSIVAAAHFNRLAAERGLAATAIARATHPEAEIRPPAAAGLALDGLRPGEAHPVLLSDRDALGARRIVTFCALPPTLATRSEVDEWDVPAVSDGYEAARDAIVARIERLLDTMGAPEPSGT